MNTKANAKEIQANVVGSCCFVQRHVPWESLQFSPKCRLSNSCPGGGFGLPSAQRRSVRPVKASNKAGLVCRWDLKCRLWLVDPGCSVSSRHQVSLSKLTSRRAVSSEADMVHALTGHPQNSYYQWLFRVALLIETWVHLSTGNWVSIWASNRWCWWKLKKT